MQTFSYTAKDASGKNVTGMLAAADEVDLGNKVSNLGYFLVKAKPMTESYAAKVGSAKGARMGQREVLNFTINLETLLNAGMPLVEALRELEKDSEKPKVRALLADILSRVESGASLREALGSHPASFSQLYTSIVGAGESTGKLSVCLGDLAKMLEWQLELNSRMGEAATYPIILLVIMVAVVTLLMVKVIPTFESMFADIGAKLPLPTQLVLGVSLFMRKCWYIIIGFVVGLVVAYKWALSIPEFRFKVDTVKLRIPVVGEMLQKIALSRFCHTLSLSIKSGVSILTAMEFGGKVVGNVVLERAITQARSAVNVGEKIAVSLKATGQFPSLVIRMISVGEHSGSLGQMLDKVNEFYDREVPIMVKRLFAMFEPVMIVLMGGVIGTILLAIFMPMLQLAKSVG